MKNSVDFTLLLVQNGRGDQNDGFCLVAVVGNLYCKHLFLLLAVVYTSLPFQMIIASIAGEPGSCIPDSGKASHMNQWEHALSKGYRRGHLMTSSWMLLLSSAMR